MENNSIRFWVSQSLKIRFFAIHLYLMIFTLSVCDVYSQVSCETALADAQEMYDLGRTLEIITLLNQCIPESIPFEEKSRAYALLARAYIAQDEIREAKEAIEKLLNHDKNFKPDPGVETAQFVDLLNQARKRRERKKRVKRLILYASGGVAAVVLAVVILTQSDEGSPLPTPPLLTDEQ